MIELAYEFQAKTELTAKDVRGLVFAPNLAFASFAVKKLGFVTPRLNVNWSLSLSSAFGLSKPKDFDLREKARLFKSLAKRITTDNNIVRALNGLQENVNDPFLVNAVNVMMGSILNGSKPDEAMAHAGFSQRDCKVVAALASSGQLSKAFADLAIDADSEQSKNVAINSALRMPKFMMFFMYIVTFLFLVYGAPRMTKFFKQLGSDFQLPWAIKWIYDLADVAALSPVLFGFAWLSMGVAILVSRSWSGWAKLWRKIPTWRRISEKSEQISIWSIFAIMYDAAIPPASICKELSLAVSSEETKQALVDLGKCFQSGGQDSVVIERSKLPAFAISAYKQAKESGAFSSNLRDDVGYWRDDVVVLTEQLSASLQIVSIVMMGGIVLLAVAAFYFPVVLPTLSKL